MSGYSSKKTSHIWLIGLMGLGVLILIFGVMYFKSDPPKDTPPIKTERPAPHIDPTGSYDRLLDLAYKNFRNIFPSIVTVRKIPEDYVRPRRKRQHKIETSEEGALIVLYADFPEQPLDMCITPCSLNTNVSEKYKIIVSKYGFEPQYWWFDTGLWPPEKVMTIPLRRNWLETFEEQKKCFDKNEARLLEDQDAQICQRFPPDMPKHAQKSGHCNMMFNISKTGYPTEVQALNCTDPVFKAAAVNTIRRWYYYPKVENNNFVERRNMRNKITFKLTDETGELIPE